MTENPGKPENLEHTHVQPSPYCTHIVERGPNKGKLCGDVNKKRCHHKRIICGVCSKEYHTDTSYYTHFSRSHPGIARPPEIILAPPKPKPMVRRRVQFKERGQGNTVSVLEARVKELEDRLRTLGGEVQPRQDRN